MFLSVRAYVSACVEGGGISHNVWEALGVGGHGDISMIIMLITILAQ